jgi:hypothetical protein
MTRLAAVVHKTGCVFMTWFEFFHHRATRYFGIGIGIVDEGYQLLIDPDVFVQQTPRGWQRSQESGRTDLKVKMNESQQFDYSKWSCIANSDVSVVALIVEYIERSSLNDDVGRKILQ